MKYMIKDEKGEIIAYAKHQEDVISFLLDCLKYKLEITNS